MLAVAALAGQYGELQSKIDASKTDIDVIRAVKYDPATAADPEVQSILNGGSSEKDRAGRLESLVRLRSLIEGSAVTAPTTIDADVKQIKSSPIYRDPGVSETSTWLSRALDRLKNLRPKTPDTPNLNLPFFGIGAWFLNLMWVVIAGVICFLIYLGVKHISWQKKIQRKASALMEEDEPERTLDEWLAQADALIAEGKFREAVRALYLACLLRFDQERVARFRRGETNWEHLARIEASPLLPQDLDFRTPTQLFDRVWYGHIVRGRDDVDQFRTWYVQITDQLTRKVAAS